VVVSKWPNHRDNTWKAPTTIAYASENQKLTRNHWGFETTRGLKQYVWTKLLLDKNADLTEFDDPLLKEMYGCGFLTLPDGKSAKDVAEDYLRELYKYTIQVLERELSAETLRTMPMECWITTPAIWTHGAQSATLEAAKAAGFGSRPNDIVNTISEPEAAALTVLKPHLGPNSIDPVQVCILLGKKLIAVMLTILAKRMRPCLRLWRRYCCVYSYFPTKAFPRLNSIGYHHIPNHRNPPYSTVQRDLSWHR
jgi:hypothetical protein